MSEEETAIEMNDITKIYPDGVVALRNVDLIVKKGEIHGLLGENGAGKTTLMRILYGEIKPSKGTIKIFGKKVRFRGPWDAIKEGIGMVYQHFSLIPPFTVLENLVLSLSSIAKVNVNEVKEKAKNIIESIGLNVPLNVRVEMLDVGVQQRVEILKVLMRDAKILILDEPTSVLTPTEVNEFLEMLRKLKKMGITIIFITHKLKEAKSITDSITILRKGRVVGVVETNKVNEIDLAKMMIGREIILKIPEKRSRPEAGSVILKVENLHVRDDKGLLAVKGVSFTLREGEILGLAGVQGNGQRELVEAIIGYRPVEKGRVIFMGEDVTGRSPSEIYGKGLAYIPDSRAIGLVLDMDVISNSILTRLKNFLSKGGRIVWDKAQSFSSKIVKDFEVVIDSLKAPVKYLSGGNQQRLLVGREVIWKPKVIIAAEPTHGLDIAATEYIRSLLVELRDRGTAILLVSTDLDEIFQLSDRIAVIYEGEIMATGRPEEFTPEKLGLLMGGVKCQVKS